MASIPVVSVVGRSNVGKTTLLEKLIAELKHRGYRVAAVKHHARGFEIDRPGKDTWRLAQAGSDVVAIVGPRRLAVIAHTPEELSLEALLERLPTDVDIVLTEGYKYGDKPKIEVSRAACGGELTSREAELIAVATDQDHPGLSVPQFGLDDASGLVDLLERKVLRPSHSHDGTTRDLDPPSSDREA